MFRVYYHYSNGKNWAGAHSKLFPTREEAESWVEWMRDNMNGFVLDQLSR